MCVCAIVVVIVVVAVVVVNLSNVVGIKEPLVRCGLPLNKDWEKKKGNRK